MAGNKKKTLVLNTLLLLFCIVVIALYTLIPLKGKEKQMFTLSFDSDGGDAIAAIQIDDCKTIEEPTNPTREGYIFKGWELNGEPFTFPAEVCGNIEVKAIWEEMAPEKEYITIYYNLGGDSEDSPMVVEKGTIPNKPEDPTREGYTFVTWQVDGVSYYFDIPLNDGDKIVAIWEENAQEEPEPEEDVEYTVKFNLNGGIAGGTCDDQTVKKGGTAKNVCKPTREGYTLNGWSPRITSKINKDTTFVAQWKQNSSSGGSSSGGGTTPSAPTTYRVSFDLDGGTGNCPTVTVNAGTSVNPSRYCTATKKHYTVNWGSARTINADYTFKASWNLNKFTATCEVIKEGDFDTPNCTIKVKEGNTVISDFTLYVSGKQVKRLTINTSTDWPKFTNMTIDYDGLTGISVSK